LRFEWDSAKNRHNIEKHGISFEEASALFLESANYMEIFDAAHSAEEDRYVAIGRIARGILVVVFKGGRRRDRPRHKCSRCDTRREAKV
jgi:uncharacterized DUF497 family protein